MSDDQPKVARSTRRGCGAALLVMLGILLLLPGVCVAITAAINLPFLPMRLLYGPPLETGYWLIMAGWALFWLICLLISYFGIRLIRRGLS
jgi:hypothetical protein